MCAQNRPTDRKPERRSKSTVCGKRCITFITKEKQFTYRMRLQNAIGASLVTRTGNEPAIHRGHPRLGSKGVITGCALTTSTRAPPAPPPFSFVPGKQACNLLHFQLASLTIHRTSSFLFLHFSAPPPLFSSPLPRTVRKRTFTAFSARMRLIPQNIAVFFVVPRHPQPGSSSQLGAAPDDPGMRQ